MAAPAIVTGYPFLTTASGTVASNGRGANPDELWIIFTMGGDSNTTVAITPHTITCSATSFGDGTGGTQATDAAVSDGTNGLYGKIWSFTTSGSAGTIDFAVSNWSTNAARRWGILRFDNGTAGQNWGAVATRVARTASQIAAGNGLTLTWSGTAITEPCVVIAAGLEGGARIANFDFDADGTDEGIDMYAGGSQAQCAGYASLDTGAAHRPDQSTMLIHFSGTNTGNRTAAAVVYRITVPTTVTGTATQSGGGVGAATGTHSGAVTGSGTQSGGGAGAALGLREAIADGVGTGGGLGQAIGVRTAIGISAGAGGGVGTGSSANTKLGIAAGLGGGVGIATLSVERLIPERSLMFNHNTHIFLEE